MATISGAFAPGACASLTVGRRAPPAVRHRGISTWARSRQLCSGHLGAGFLLQDFYVAQLATVRADDSSRDRFG